MYGIMRNRATLQIVISGQNLLDRTGRHGDRPLREIDTGGHGEWSDIFYRK